MHAEVFAVEATSVQVCWRGADGGELRVGDQRLTLPAAAGALVVGGLEPATTYTLEVGSRRVRVRTLARPPGAELSRFATFNDMHIGARSFGTWRPLWEDDPADPHANRCFRSALAEAMAWGAQAIVIKGDATQRGRRHEWETAARMVAATGLPAVWIEGNHETKYDAVDGRPILAAHGLALTTGRPSHLDRPGIRIIGVPTARWRAGNGRIEAPVRAEAVALARDAPDAAFVALHHYPQRFRYPTLYPSGIPSEWAVPFLDGLAQANPATLVVAGHSHRHRYHEHGPLVVAETGSTKDFPGTWSGYTVHEGGIMQTTRRVMDPRAFAWTERGRRVIGGVWGVWSPGVRSHRCFSLRWPVR